jgi:hypothetical protein
VPDSLPDGAWHQRLVPRGTVWVVGVLAAVAVAAVWTQAWILFAVPVIGLANIARTVVDVRVDATGLTVRSLLGRPRLHVEAADVLRAETRAHVSALADFGGHGWRTSTGGTRGIVVRDGEALVVDRRDEPPVVVSVDDADGAARALASASRATRER